MIDIFDYWSIFLEIFSKSDIFKSGIFLFCEPYLTTLVILTLKSCDLAQVYFTLNSNIDE